jgi:antitoxin component of MazEF toxin-antitoxin module
MSKITMQQTGETLALSIPAEVIVRLGLQAGQEFTILEVAGGFKLVPFDVELDRQLRLADEVLAEQAEALALLARH